MSFKDLSFFQSSVALTNAGVVGGLYRRSFDDYVCENDSQKRVLKICQNYVKNASKAMDSNAGMLLHGNTGTGKTHLAQAMVKSLVANDYIAEYVRFNHMMLRVIPCESHTNRENINKLEAYYMKDFLVIDDVSPLIDDRYHCLLHDILDNRESLFKPTIFVSSLPIEANPSSEVSISSLLGERAMDRLGCGMKLHFDWESYRGKMDNSAIFND